ncbi:hypothetical protein GCM10023187_19860 [Nibrella viscosa]|uniref:Por secretion system C-terminal sorting domain-containing protein n=1 Tax=Nibrella viscosa TaxID=1084524 RepID=A0ABP8KCM3_9BACT
MKFRYWLGSLLLGLTLQAAGQSGPALVRGPYLQVITPTSVVVRWRTSLPTDSRVFFGRTSGSMTQQTTDAKLTQEHIITLTGLQPATTYAYSVGHAGNKAGDWPAYQFKTALPKGSTAPFRVWALGDFGIGSENQLAVRDQYLNYTKSRPADLWLWLGDNAYCCGRDNEFQQYVFDVYPRSLFGTTPVWPTPGNHDYHDDVNDFSIDYYKLFSMPQQAEAGGVPSGSQAYYSFDYGNVHFISLDSFGNEAGKHRLYDTTGTQVQWLKRDLAANQLPWTIVFFHHPAYTKGSRNSDTEEELVLIRQNLLPILERYNVDLVLNGHSHIYERTYLLKGHTGAAGTFDPAKHIVSASTGRYDGSVNSCPLVKGQGTVYVVAGSGGALSWRATDYPHPAMVYANRDIGGSLILDMNDNRLNVQWLATDGVVRDQFTMLKNVSKTTSTTVALGDTVRLTASWPGQYSWSEGQTTRSVVVRPPAPGTYRYTVKDQQGCLQDAFTVTVGAITGLEPQPEEAVLVYPNPATDQITVELPLKQPADIILRLTDPTGRLVYQAGYKATTQSRYQVPLPQTTGLYVVTVQLGQRTITRTVMRR